jgi:hypothetical protein
VRIAPLHPRAQALRPPAPADRIARLYTRTESVQCR